MLASAAEPREEEMHKVAFGAVALVLSALAAPAAFAAGMKLTSAEVSNGATIRNAQVFNSFTCTGDNISPSLSWSGAPKGTKSFVITVYDPDAPTGSGWWHWVVINIPASTTSVPKNAGDPKANLLPEGALQTRTDFGAPGYGGPCPPKGDKPHHYHFTVFAVDEDKLQFAQNDQASAALVGYELNFHTLAKASLIGRYSRLADKKK
jgi:Raf kinase inhibitor-like YbhB/YbcL family protein